MALRWPQIVTLAIIFAGPTASVTGAVPVVSEPNRAQRMVMAADAFLATLSPTQRIAVMFAFDDDAQRHRWSNLPDPFVQRKGVRWGELDRRQRTALIALLASILSPDGLRMVQEQMAADDVLRTRPQRPPGPPPRGEPGDDHGRGGRPPFGGPPLGAPPGPPPGSGFTRGPGRPRGPGQPGPGGAGPGGPSPANFGSDWYYVSFLGAPSATAPWMLQFGGHHLGLNATVAGARVTLAPSLTGGEPLRFTSDGRRVYIVEREVTAAAALLAGLAPAQRAKAIVSTQRIDLVLGPGQDGRVLQPEGLAGSAMTPSQRQQFLTLIAARVGIVNSDASAPSLARIARDLDRTYFAWFGPVTPLGAAYFRITGPSVLMEYSPQDLDGDVTDHAHNMYRDPTNDYGVAWTGWR